MGNQFKKIVVQLFPYTIILLVIFFVANVSMQNPVVNFNYRLKKIVHSVLPEGWAFFTKDPKTAMEDIYRLENDHFVKVNFRFSEPANLFGLSRKSTKIAMEASFIAKQVPDSLWKTTYNENDFYTIVSAYTINDKSNLAFIGEGIYLITSYRPVPWAYANQPENFKRQYRYIHVIIK